ncbi:MAG TPA: type I 3-dehydroquinate dehydratase [Thermoanaerobaculia bacterium]|nr:type I 3-dehydroquinate dehydratase [Thermoanaerobaculia bacterium]
METSPARARATLVATVTTLPAGSAVPMVSDLEGVDWLEIRADLVGDLDAARLARVFPGKLLYTLRSRAEGGGSEGTPERRRQRLIEAAGRYDYVDLEAARDLTPDILKGVPAEKRVISWHGPAPGVDGLTATFERMATVPAALYKLVPTAAQAGEEVQALLLLASLGRRDVAAFAAGAIGAWTRLVAPRLGAPVVYGALGEVPGAPGQISIERLRRDYGLPELPPIEALFGLLGNPVTHSLSPRIHNTAYRALGIPAVYLPFHAESFGDFWLEVIENAGLEAIGLSIRGLSVTAPFKESALAVCGAESPLVSLIGAANTLVCNQGVWEAEATDPDGVVLPLRDRGLRIEGMEVAVVGAGGAGRSAAAGLDRAGARVTMFNRDPERGKISADHLKVTFRPLADLDPSQFDLLINATSLGRGADDPLPFDVSRLREGAVVIDLVYFPDRPTRLLTEAAARGAVAIDGREVLVDQARGQFRLMTGRDLPLDLARRAAGLEPEAEDAP